MDIISDVIISIAATLNFCFVTLQNMAVPNFMPKAFSDKDYARVGAHSLGHDQTKILKANVLIYFVNLPKTELPR